MVFMNLLRLQVLHWNFFLIWETYFVTNKVLLPDDGAEDDCIAILGSHDDQAWIAVEEDPHVPEGAGEDIF